MANTPEGKVKDKIKAVLKAHGVYYHMPVQNGMGAPSLDFICCHKGAYLAIEAKAPSKEPTARQCLTISEIEDAGGYCVICDGSTDAMAHLDFVLDLIGRKSRG